MNDSDVDNSPKGQLIAQNYIVQDMVTQAETNDTYFSNQWALESMYVAGDSTSTNYAWDTVKTNKAVTVAVIDEGFQANHADLAGNVVATYNATDKSADVSEVSGQKGHGTHVAGIVGAVANNGVGVAGVSYNARLLLIKGMKNGGFFIL